MIRFAFNIVTLIENITCILAHRAKEQLKALELKQQLRNHR